MVLKAERNAVSLKRTGISPRVKKGINQGSKGHTLGLGRERLGGDGG